MRTLHCSKCSNKVIDDVTQDDESRYPKDSPFYLLPDSSDVPVLCKRCNEVRK